MNFFPQRLLGLTLIVSCFLATTVDGQEVRRAIPVNPPISQTPVQRVAPYGPPSMPAVVASPANQSTGPSPAVGVPSTGEPAPQVIPPPVAGPASIDDTARFLAGLPVSEGSPLGPLERTAIWQQHATFFDEAWAKLAARQLTGIRDWEVNYLPDATQPLPVMFYMFSGPDFLYANQFFPNADTYILAGTEPIGPLPDALRFGGPALEPVLQNLQKSLNSVLNFSFFITKEMKTNLQNEQLKGTLPIFYVFLARAGRTISEINFITLDKNGQLSQASPDAKSKSLTPGVRISFAGPSGTPRQTLYYFTTDLSNEGIRSQPGFLKFCAAQGMGASLLKSASYLMFENGFTRIKEFLLNQSRAIVQDDSGIPVSAFDPARWSLRFFGSYAGPIDLFKQYYQPQLQGLYQQSNPVPLHFGIGYRWAPRQSTLIVATLKGTEVSPLQTVPIAPSTPSQQH
jgi:hypothetical protein